MYVYATQILQRIGGTVNFMVKTVFIVGTQSRMC